MQWAVWFQNRQIENINKSSHAKKYEWHWCVSVKLIFTSQSIQPGGQIFDRFLLKNRACELIQK